ncbi:MAG TPA: EF-hand domain-containing protein [Steroidobacteraceae bacterium]|jgi:Ca2+-binding EF-hand superfamily protein
MISGVGGSAALWSSLYAGSSGSSTAAGSSADLSQVEQKLFAKIDTNGDGTIDKTELSNFFNTLSAQGSSAAGATAAASPASVTSVGTSGLFSSLDTSGDGSISEQEFSANVGSLVDQLRSQLTANVASSAASTTAAATTQSTATQQANSSNNNQPHHHHGHGHRGDASSTNGLVGALLKQYSVASAGSSSATSGTTVSTSA